MQHSYWLPTNRLIEKSLSSYCEEIEYCQKKYNVSIPVYILDSGDNIIEKRNKETIDKAKELFNDIKINHITFNTQKAILGKILNTDNLSVNWINYFMNTKTNYGAVMNRIYLLATAFGYDVIHRRDSDTVLQKNCPYPLELELKYIANKTSNGKSQVRIVGSGYIDEWNLDIKDLIKGDDNKFNIFLDCLNIPKEQQKEYIATTYADCKKTFKSDIVLVNKKTPEAGNFCVYELFKQFPCMPANNTLGTDYFTFKVAKALGWDIVFHERRVKHEYHDERKSEEKKHNYFKSLIKLCDQSPVYWRLFYDFQRLNHEKRFSSDNVNIAETISDLLLHSKYAYIDKRSENYDKFVNELLFPNHNAEALEFIRNKDKILEECYRDYDIHILLIKDWKTIINNAKRIQCNLI